jgi:hypothetical protein
MWADGLLRPLRGLITLMPTMPIIEFGWRCGDRKSIMQTWVLAQLMTGAMVWTVALWCCWVNILEMVEVYIIKFNLH